MRNGLHSQTAHMRSMILHPTAPRGKAGIQINVRSAKPDLRQGFLRRGLSATGTENSHFPAALSAGREI